MSRIRVTAKAQTSLATLHTRMMNARYSGALAGRGWGSLTDDDQVIGTSPAQRPAGGQPQLHDETDLLPQRLRARFYWNQPDRAVLRRMGGNVPEHQRSTLQAVDVVVVQDAPGEFSAFVSTTNSKDLTGPVRDALQGLSAPQDVVSVTIGYAGYEIPPDLFRWLIHRFNGEQELTEAMRLVGLQAVKHRDALGRATTLDDFASLDRTTVLAAVTEGNARFGPAKVQLRHEQLNLDLYFELRLDGGFSVFTGPSEYDDDEIGENLGVQLVYDAGFHVVPDLLGAYTADTGWTATERDASIQEARTTLREALEG